MMRFVKFAVVALALLCSLAIRPAAAQQLDDAGLKTMLDGLGYEPKPLTKGFLIAIKSGEWTYNMQLTLSPDKTKLGINANLGSVDDIDAVPASKWMALLVSNGDIDPSDFYFDKNVKKVYLHRTLDNRAITPAYLRDQVQHFTDNIHDTADLWDFTK